MTLSPLRLQRQTPEPFRTHCDDRAGRHRCYRDWQNHQSAPPTALTIIQRCQRCQSSTGISTPTTTWASHTMSTLYYLPPTAYYLLIYCLLPIAYCLYRLLPTIYYLPFIILSTIYYLHPLPYLLSVSQHTQTKGARKNAQRHRQLSLSRWYVTC
jgi:hypothetical protein